MTRNAWLLIAVAGLASLSAWSVWTGYQASLERKASQEAREKREDALQALVETLQKTQQDLDAANARTAAALQRAAEAQARERITLDRLREISTRRREDLGSVASKSDIDLSDSVVQSARILYPEESRPMTVVPTGDGIHISRAALEAFGRSLIETASLREETAELRRLDVDRLARIDSLTDLVEAERSKTAALETRISALESVRIADGERIVALERELRAERRKAWFKSWKGRAEVAGALAVGLTLGRLMAP